MTNVGFGTLDVIPSVRGLRAELDRQTSTFAASGRASGRKYGDAVAAGAGSRLKTSMKAALAPAAGILAGLGGVRIFGDMIAEAQEAAKVGKITERLVKTTGGAANLSATQVGNLATSLSKYAAVDDELIQSSENVLLTFRNVRNEAGKGNDVFSRATKAALDLSTVLGGDLKGSTLQLGKALQDPIKGITALGRAGVQFSESQKAQIKSFVASNDLLSAQKLILAEVEKQVGGAAGANATALDRLGVSFKNLEEAAGTAAAPALNKFATIATNDLIPALEGAGGLAADAVHAFGSLPGPVKAAAGAFVALRVASATGLGTTLAAGATSAASAMTSLRLKAMFAADAYRSVAGASGSASAGNARLAGSFAAVKAASAGAGAAVTRGLKGSLALVGGPWGAALLAGTAVLAHFWGEHQKAKQRIEDFTAALKADSGALADNTKAAVTNALEKDGILKDAVKLGFSLETVTKAALGDKDALASLTSTLQGYKNEAARAAEFGSANGQEMQANVINAQALIGKIQGTSGALADSSAAYKRQSEAMGANTTAQGQATQATVTYADKIKAAKDAVQKLLDVENKRRNANLSIFQDRTRIAAALDDARKEAAKGTKTLSEQTEEGRKNRDSLASLADAWNSAGLSVKNAKGAYADMRQNFIDVATAMGAPKSEAKKLANQLLGLPTNKPITVTTPGMAEAIQNVKDLKEQLRGAQRLSRIVITAQAGKNQAAISDIHRANGGPIRGPGSGTSDSILMWGSNGEYMQRKAAVDYYGVDFMNALNSLRVPRYATGGPVGGAPTAASVALGQEIAGSLRIVDGVAYIEGIARGVDARNRRASRVSALEGGRPW